MSNHLGPDHALPTLYPLVPLLRHGTRTATELYVGRGIEVSADSIVFPAVEVGQPARATIVITNPGQETLILSDIRIEGPDAASFSVVNTGRPFPLSVTYQSSISVTVGFAPGTEGPKSATMIIAHDAPDSLTTVSLTGTANPPVQAGDGLPPGDNVWVGNGPPECAVERPGHRSPETRNGKGGPTIGIALSCSRSTSDTRPPAVSV